MKPYYLEAKEEMFEDAAVALQKRRSDIDELSLVKEAVSLFLWAAEQKSKGNAICSCSKEGLVIENVTTPMLTEANKRVKK